MAIIYCSLINTMKLGTLYKQRNSNTEYIMNAYYKKPKRTQLLCASQRLALAETNQPWHVNTPHDRMQNSTRNWKAIRNKKVKWVTMEERCITRQNVIQYIAIKVS